MAATAAFLISLRTNSQTPSMMRAAKISSDPLGKTGFCSMVASSTIGSTLSAATVTLNLEFL